ncbi:hypothetical protein Efla_007410 [Eimeria flavescens]
MSRGPRGRRRRRKEKPRGPLVAAGPPAAGDNRVGEQLIEGGRAAAEKKERADAGLPADETPVRTQPEGPTRARLGPHEELLGPHLRGPLEGGGTEAKNRKKSFLNGKNKSVIEEEQTRMKRDPKDGIHRSRGRAEEGRSGVQTAGVSRGGCF